MLYLVILLLQIFTIATARIHGPLVKTPLGKIEGKWDQSYNNKTFSAFVGIPYAQPPIGYLRFREPYPILPWNDIWVANKSVRCPSLASLRVTGNEDCLYLNIYVPSINPSQILNKLSVFFDIHGGGFMKGANTIYSGPHYLMDRDVILVTPNYRLGPLGFLSTEDDVVPGNNGMKDQVAALKFVKKYISYFGGNPEEITLMGLSAGGASVHYHYLSPMTKGLFKNGISASGTALNPWTLQEAPLKKAIKLGQYCGCPTRNTSDLIECLRYRPVEQIIREVKHFYAWVDSPLSAFGPVVEKAGSNTFLPEHPYKMLKNGDVQDLPWLATMSTSEGLCPAAKFLDSPEILADLEENWIKYCPAIFEFQYTIPANEQSKVCAQIKEFYLNNQTVSRDTFDSLVLALTDRLFTLDIEKAVKLQAAQNKAPVYLYRFNYTSEKHHSFIQFFAKTPKYGVAHGDDMMLIFSIPNRPLLQMTPNDEIMKDILLDFFLTFAKSGKPVSNGINWLPVHKTENYLYYLQINSPNSLKMRKERSIARDTFWNSLGFKENENV